MHKELFKKLQEVQKLSYSPYSHFRVACIIKLKNGKEFIGANIENAAYGDCLCAERVAMVQMKLAQIKNEDVEYLSVIGDSDEIVSPCGSCRQVMAELLSLDTKIIMFNRKGEYIESTVEGILPYTFTKSAL